MIAAADITKGQTFTNRYGQTFTATEDVQVDEFDSNGGYKVLVTEAGDTEEFWHLMGRNDMFTAK